ncbi:hypothetical protein [Gracilibacillus salinarum]|uniref:Glycine zipper family protein n=1 Tax=Gracilibacillus salinarum TaxID=2932255 RepID=A0ABY4GNI0_9BACI|nr:hypothetical protein [Gracilibacillus salinarum]UOQ85759.1 hypothetical protein MUN87_02290 [Gracilibacillus salinarum]
MTNKNNNKNLYVGYGVAFGLLGGAVFSTVVEMFIKTPIIWAFGPGLGMLIGIVIGTIMDSTKGEK